MYGLPLIILSALGYDSEWRLGPRVPVRPDPEQELLPGIAKIRKLAETRTSLTTTNLG